MAIVDNDPDDGAKPILIDSAEKLAAVIQARADRAARPQLELAGKPYCPSSGTEGMAFEERYCCQCVHYRQIADDTWDCRLDILMQAHAVADADDPSFPKQWIYDADGVPTCTAFEEPPDVDDDRRMHRLCGGTTNPAAELELYRKALRGELL